MPLADGRSEGYALGEPLDPESDDPQDFNQLHPEDTYLVFYEDALVWSVRPGLPPSVGEPRSNGRFATPWHQGRADVGRYAFDPKDPHRRDHPDRRIPAH